MNKIYTSFMDISEKQYARDKSPADILSRLKDAGKWIREFEASDTFFQDESPGNFTYELSLPENSRVKKAVFRVEGIRYEGIIKSPGISITPVDEGITKSLETSIRSVDKSSFIIDFHGFRTLTYVGYLNQNVTINEIKQWGGTNFIKGNVLLDKPFLIKTDKILITLNRTQDLASFENNLIIAVISYPLNLTLSLGDGSPFWNYPGELIGEAIVPDFSDKLNDYLESCRSRKDTGKICKIPLRFHSDSPGKMKPTEEVDANLVWKNPFSESYPAKKVPVLSFYGETQKVQLELTSSKNSIQLIGIDFNCKGNFSNEFIDDNWGDTEKKNMGVILSTGMNIGLRLEPSHDLNSTGVDLYLLKRNKDVRLLAEIAEDKDGKPDEEKILSSKNVELSSEQDGWRYVKFDETVPLDKEKTYWLVLKAGIGEVEWLCSEDEKSERTPEGFIFRKEPTSVWNSYSLSAQSPLRKIQLIGYFRLKYLPDSESIFPVTFKLGEKSRALKPSAEPEPVNMNLEEVPPLLVVKGKAIMDLEIISRASGKLELSDIAVEGKELINKP